ncbi:MAG: hypothetical protein P8Y21_12500 [Gemmatimonadales bacterium]
MAEKREQYWLAEIISQVDSSSVRRWKLELRSDITNFWGNR